MAINNTINVVDKLTELKYSTTLFLESLRGDTLKVIIESQDELSVHQNPVIRRVTKLYFDSPDIPLLYCVSALNKNALTKEEYESLVDGILPIGIVFHRYNDPHSIKKTNVHVSKEINSKLARSLNVSFDLVVQKRYDYWAGGRLIGQISEFFNEESLGRL